MECDFILHDTCANIPRIIQHALHHHPLTLKAGGGYDYDYFRCIDCRHYYGGFFCQCPIKECYFELDIRCASISEPFDYQGVEHCFFLSLDAVEKKNHT